MAAAAFRHASRYMGLAVACLAWMGTHNPPVTAAPGASGISTNILTLGRRGSYLTATIKLHNKTDAIYFVALAGQPPSAVDSGGTAYNISTIAGIARCPMWEIVAQCIGIPAPRANGTLISQAFTRIDPKADIYLTLVFYGRDSRAPLGSVSASLLYRTVADDLSNDGLNEEQKRSQLKMMNLGAPPVSIVDSLDQ